MVDTLTSPSDDESRKQSEQRASQQKAEEGTKKETQYGMEAVQSTAAEGEAQEAPSKAADDHKMAEEAPPKPRERKVAIFVAHGMGQQIPFQTLDQVAEGLRKQDTALCQSPMKSNVRAVKFEDQWLSRIEMKMKSCTNQPVEVHLYEGYWAPLTEGKITGRGVIEFLSGAAQNGISNGSRTFNRWLFGSYREFPSPIRIVLYLLIALATVTALVAMNTTIALVAAGRGLLEKTPDWLSNSLFADLTTTFNVVVTAMAVFGLSLGIAYAMRKWKLPSGVRKGWGTLTIILFIAVLFMVILAALSLGFLFYGHVKLKPGDQLWYRIFPTATVNGFNEIFSLVIWWGVVIVGGGFLAWWIFKIIRGVVRDIAYYDGRWYTLLVTISLAGLLALMIWLAGAFANIFDAIGKSETLGTVRDGLSWPLLIAVSGFVKQKLVQYVGDVAIYVTPYKVDGFFQLRGQIRDCVQKVMQAVYGMQKQDGSGPEYDEVIVVGHSLGSVVVYDALNRIVNNDLAAGGSLRVVDRTPLLLTFGSPLDKTAFLFAVQRKHTDEAREALAATVQPLLQEYTFRPKEWINIYSPWDLISGDLGFYDPPGSSDPKRVINHVDPDATTLLAAHVEYWSNPFLFQTLYRAL